MLPKYFSSYACRNFKSGDLLLKLCLEKLFTNNKKSIYKTKLFITEIAKYCLKHAIYINYSNIDQ